jgi:CRP/FNR family transcriptional regulator
MVRENTMQKLLDLISDSPIFRPASPDNQAAIAGLATCRTYRKGELVARQGERWPYLLMVVEGHIDVAKESGEGRRLTLVTIRPGEVFWGTAFFDGRSALPASFEAREDSAVATWSTDALLPVLTTHGEVLWALCGIMVRRMQEASRILEGLAFQPVAGRVARLILDLAGDMPHEPVARDLTLDEIAARVGSTREVVCRVLYRFADENLIEITRTEFLLTDTDGLSGVAQQE